MLKARQKFDKYKIERRLGEGGFATVYRAMDTIEGIRVALKTPHASLIDKTLLNDCRHEVRLTAKLEHPNILPLKHAGFIDGSFVIVTPLGDKTLGDRLKNRIGFAVAMDFAHQLLDAVAYAHRHRIVHCDIKPENIILFSGNRLRLTDFGTAKVALRTGHSSGTGTFGFMAPEQAMGKPSYRSDVFSVGLIIYRMLSGYWPHWPCEWPPAGYNRLRGRVHQELIELLKKSIDVRPHRCFRDGDHMLAAFCRIDECALQHAETWRRHKQHSARTGTRKS